MTNPYLEEFERLSFYGADHFHIRSELVCKFSWAIPNEEAIKTLCELEPLVEIGAGTGYWAWMIRQAGGRINAYDKKPGNNRWAKGTHTVVHEGRQRCAKRYPDHALMLGWPMYADPMAAECLELYKGETLAYMGEGYGGCTGDNRFHKLLEERFVETQCVDIPQWYGIHDTLTVWKRK